MKTILIQNKRFNIRLIIVLSFSFPSLIIAENYPFDHTSKEAVRNYVPEKIFSIETTFSSPSSKGLGKMIEIYDDRCVYFYFFDYKQCFEMSEENYLKFVEFLENEKKWDSKMQDYCCRYSGFLQYSSEKSILRSCSKLYSKDSKIVNEHCGSDEELDYENRVFTILDELVLNNAGLDLSMQGLLDDILKSYRKYVLGSGSCANCVPSYFHSPKLRDEDEKTGVTGIQD